MALGLTEWAKTARALASCWAGTALLRQTVSRDQNNQTWCLCWREQQNNL